MRNPDIDDHRILGRGRAAAHFLAVALNGSFLTFQDELRASGVPEDRQELLLRLRFGCKDGLPESPRVPQRATRELVREFGELDGKLLGSSAGDWERDITSIQAQLELIEPLIPASLYKQSPWCWILPKGDPELSLWTGARVEQRQSSGGAHYTHSHGHEVLFRAIVDTSAPSELIWSTLRPRIEEAKYEDDQTGQRGHIELRVIDERTEPDGTITDLSPRVGWGGEQYALLPPPRWRRIEVLDWFPYEFKADIRRVFAGFKNPLFVNLDVESDGPRAIRELQRTSLLLERRDVLVEAIRTFIEPAPSTFISTIESFEPDAPNWRALHETEPDIAYTLFKHFYIDITHGTLPLWLEINPHLGDDGLRAKVHEDYFERQTVGTEHSYDFLPTARREEVEKQQRANIKELLKEPLGAAGWRINKNHNRVILQTMASLLMPLGGVEDIPTWTTFEQGALHNREVPKLLPGLIYHMAGNGYSGHMTQLEIAYEIWVDEETDWKTPTWLRNRRLRDARALISSRDLWSR